MAADGATARRAALECVDRVRDFLLPYLWQPSRYERDLVRPVGREEEDNVSFLVDVRSEEIIDRVLAEVGLAASIFSEEAGWHGDPAGDYVVICDPLDNSFLSTRAFRDSAVAVSVGDAGGGFLCTAVADLSTAAVYLADECGAWVLERDGGTWAERPARTSAVTRLDDAFLVLPAILRTGRSRALAPSALVERPNRMITMDGVILVGRLAAGYVDAYVDVVVGQALYEMPALEAVVRAGGTVTDAEGVPFDFRRLVASLRADPERTTTVVAAATAELHAAILSAVREI